LLPGGDGGKKIAPREHNPPRKRHNPWAGTAFPAGCYGANVTMKPSGLLGCGIAATTAKLKLLSTPRIVENRPRSATARAASEVEVEIFTPTEFLDHIASSPRAARELIQRLSQRLREADDRIVNDERRSGRAHGTRKDADSQTAVESVNNAYLAAKSPWLQRQFRTPLGLGDLPFIIGRGPVAGEALPPLQPNLKLDDTVPFRLSRNHFMIEKRDGNYYVRDLCSTLGTIVNGEPMRHCERERMK
jgi:CRP/FNR family transcriptional regulator, cyclic AMP receptor protein